MGLAEPRVCRTQNCKAVGDCWQLILHYVRIGSRAAGAILCLWLAFTLCRASDRFPSSFPRLLHASSNGPGRSIHVSNGPQLQAALNSASRGDSVILQAGATYIGNFRLPNKPGDSFITVTTSALASLPAEGTRVSPLQSQFMPKLLAARGDASLIAANGAHHYRIIGIEFAPPPSVVTYDIVKIGLGTEKDASTLPHDIVLDRVYIHGDPVIGAKRGIALNGSAITVENSYISDIKWRGQDTQAICGWNGPGPFKILNNYLEAAGENIMFGGATSSIPKLVPSDIEVRRNHLFKPLSWRKQDPSYDGQQWAVKNLFELKNAQRVLVDGNVMENNWTMGQNGTAVLFTPRAEDGRMPWAVVQDVIFTHNLIRHVASVFNFMGIDNGDRSGRGIVRLHRILIQNNLLQDVSRSLVGYGMLYGFFSAPDSVTIDHNTGFADGFVALADGGPSTRLRFTNNIAQHAQHGFIASGTAEGTATLTKFFPGAVFVKNVIIGGNASLYPLGNFFPQSLSEVGFTDYREAKYELTPSSRYRNMDTDGKALGADIPALEAATAGVVAASSGRVSRVKLD
jgi:hypothetical protein